MRVQSQYHQNSFATAEQNRTEQFQNTCWQTAAQDCFDSCCQATIFFVMRITCVTHTRKLKHCFTRVRPRPGVDALDVSRVVRVWLHKDLSISFAPYWIIISNACLAMFFFLVFFLNIIIFHVFACYLLKIAFSAYEENN